MIYATVRDSKEAKAAFDELIGKTGNAYNDIVHQSALLKARVKATKDLLEDDLKTTENSDSGKSLTVTDQPHL